MSRSPQSRRSSCPAPEHEIEGKIGSCGEFVIDDGEIGKVRGVVPLLTWGRGCADVVAVGNGAAHGHVAGTKKVEFVSQGEGGDGAPGQL